MEKIMKTKKRYIAIAVTALSSLILFTACKHQTNRTGFIFDYVTESLDLTETQQEQLESIRDEIMALVDIMHEDKDEVHAILKEQLTSEAVDKEVIRQLVADHRSKMDSILDLAIVRLADFHSDLTPEQRTKLVTKLEKFEKHHGSSRTK
jgi:Spy/CpxP family protein refolding chaperone